jgi:uncharacterized protein (DUF927 family)
MKFGEIYTFKYKKKITQSRTIIFLEENKEEVIGLRIDGINQRLKDNIFKLVNIQMLKERYSDEGALKIVLQRQKDISDRELANLLLENKKEKKPSRTTILECMDMLLRAYQKKRILTG